jgi:hypothetical protein
MVSPKNREENLLGFSLSTAVLFFVNILNLPSDITEGVARKRIIDPVAPSYPTIL